MLHFKKKMLILVMIIMAECMSITALAHTIPDYGRKGSITLTLMYEGIPVSGGSLTLYRVAGINEDDGNYEFVKTGPFANSGIDISDIDSPVTAALLADYVSAWSLKGETKAIGENGTVCFSDLELGLYLVIQQEIPEGYHGLDPFLVTVPMYENGTYIYDVVASPKTELKKDTTPGDSGSSKTPEESSTNKEGGEILPQTGQLNWPIPILIIGGMVLFYIGWELRFGKKKEKDEE